MGFAFIDAHTRGGAEVVDLGHGEVENRVKVCGADSKVIGRRQRGEVRTLFERADQRVIDKDKQNWRKRAALFDATMDGNVGRWA